MQTETPARADDKVFYALVIALTAGFAYVMGPFFAAILWALIAAILFSPMARRIEQRFPKRQNTAALLTLIFIIAMVIVPAIILALALAQEVSYFYEQIQSGHIDFRKIFEQIQGALPGWATAMLERIGLGNFSEAREMLSDWFVASFRSVATQTLQFGQSAFSFVVAFGVMLYLTFFLLRDGPMLGDKFAAAAPIRATQREALIAQFVTVIRATIKGSIVVAIVQGLIGGVVFSLLGIQGALLWGVLMGVFSLLPAIGTGLVWVPVAIYLLATGALWQGLALVFCGLFVIGMVDNVLRPILVGRDTRIPDYVVLISTLGGIELFGFSGIVIGPVIAAMFIAVWKLMADIRQAEAAEIPAT